MHAVSAIPAALFMLALWGCSEDPSNPDASRPDASADAGAQDAGAQDAGAQDAGAQDAGAQDAGAQDAGADAGETPTVNLACATARNAEGDVTPIRVELPGAWRMEACDVQPIFEFELAFGQSAAVSLTPAMGTDGFTVARGIAGDGSDLGQVAGGAGAYAFSPAPETQRVQLQVHGLDGVGFELQLRRVECSGALGCDASEYCAPEEWICVDCADGNDLFGGDGARLSGAPTAIDINAAADGILCADDEDWYVMTLAAGEAVELVGAGAAMAFEADDAALSRGDLAPAPERPLGPVEDRAAWQDIRNEIHEFIRGQDLSDLTGRWVSAQDRARTIWVRVDPNLHRRPYRFEPVGGLNACENDVHCRPGSYCGAEQTCRPCAFGADPNDNVHLSSDAAPIPLAVGSPVAGAVCGADIDWYAVTIDQPEGSPTYTTIQVESDEPIGLQLVDVGVTPVDGRMVGEEGWDQRLPLRGIFGRGVFLVAVVGAPGAGTRYTISAILEEN